MGLLKLIREQKNLYEYDKDELISLLEEGGISLEDRQLDYYIGSGAYGDVYKVKGKNKVIKFTHNDDEFYKIEKILQEQERVKPENVVIYFYNKAISHNLFFSVMEYLEKPEIKFDSFFKKALQYLERYALRVIDDGKYDDSNESYNQSMNEMKIRDLIDHMVKNRNATLEDKRGMEQAFKDIVKNYSELNIAILLSWIWGVISILRTTEVVLFIYKLDAEYEFFNDIINGIKELEKMKVYHGDVHHGNILKDPKTGKHKIIDPL